jgi:hypothetical protein
MRQVRAAVSVVYDEQKSYRWLFPDASRRVRSELGEKYT